MDARLLTIGLIVTVAVVLIAWDIYVAFFNDVPNEWDTESGVMRQAGSRFVAIPFWWGALAGHFWGPLFGFRGWPFVVGLFSISIGLTCFHYMIRKTMFRPPTWFALVYVFAGIPLGALLWPQ